MTYGSVLRAEKYIYKCDGEDLVRTTASHSPTTITVWIGVDKSENRNMKCIPQLLDQKSCVQVRYPLSLKARLKLRILIPAE